MNWDQLRTILWLRWRLTRNQWARSKGVGAVLSAILATMACITGGMSFLVALVGGVLALGKADVVVIWELWCGLTAGFLFLWMIGLLAELQRSETIDLQRLMHLPVALGQMFVINYLASHLTGSIIMIVPAMMGLALGLAISRGPAMLLLIPLALGMVFMISAWTYCLRGWLAALMNNPRKRRTVTVFIMFAFILLGQAPNLYFNVLNRPSHRADGSTPEQAQSRHDAQHAANQAKLDQFRSAQKYIPPLWLPLGARALAEGSAWPALGGTLGCVAIGALGLRRAYQGTIRFYRGEASGKVVAPAQPTRSPVAASVMGATGRGFLERRLPGVPEPAAAMALATLRSFLRAPEVKLAWGTSFVATLIIAGSVMFRDPQKISETAKPFVATAGAVFSVFFMVQFFVNQFGFDRDGFRALVLCPAERKYILLGKNLACLPVGATFGVALLGLMAFRLPLPPTVFLAALCQLAALLMLAGIVGNLISIFVPYRIQPGSMKPTKLPALAMFALIACQILFPVAMSPAFVPPVAEYLWHGAGLPSAVPVNLIFSVGLTVVIALVYWLLLEPMGRLLQNRETKILRIVTVEVE